MRSLLTAVVVTLAVAATLVTAFAAFVVISFMASPGGIG